MVLPTREEIVAELSRRSLLDFTKYTFAEYEVNWHHKVVGQALDDVLEGRNRWLLILEPPQNGKSEQVSRRFPAYALGKRPDKRILAASYNADLAADMARDVQKIVDSPQYRVLFPNTRLAEGKDLEVRTTRQFQVVGRRGFYYAAGVGGGMTGKSADIGIIDDPVKNREEAESKTYREMVWSWFTSTFLTRQFGDEGAIIVTLTHWHEDDLAGRLLKLMKDDPEAPQFRVIKLEAIAETPNPEYDPRAIGEALWPAKYPVSELKLRKAVMGKYEWSSLYQQAPTPPGGKLFKTAWFEGKIVDAAPAKARRVRGWDTAATEDDGDYTCGVLMAEAEDIFYIEDVKRGQWGPSDVDKNIKLTAELDGRDVSVREEKEGGASGKTVIEARAKMMKGYDYKGVTVDKNKIGRARPFRSQCEAGNVRLVRGPWNKAYLDELCDFPTGSNDDQVDGSSCSFNAVLLEPKADSSLVW